MIVMHRPRGVDERQSLEVPSGSLSDLALRHYEEKVKGWPTGTIGRGGQTGAEGGKSQLNMDLPGNGSLHFRESTLRGPPKREVADDGLLKLSDYVYQEELRMRKEMEEQRRTELGLTDGQG